MQLGGFFPLFPFSTNPEELINSKPKRIKEPFINELLNEGPSYSKKSVKNTAVNAGLNTLSKILLG